MKTNTNIPYRKSDYYDENGNLLDKNNKPFPYYNEGLNRKQRRYDENPDKGRGRLFVLQTGKYRIRIQRIYEIIARQRVRTHSDKNSRIKTIYGKLINVIRHSEVTGNIER